MNARLLTLVIGLVCFGTFSRLDAQLVPQMVNYQGRLLVGSTNFNGNGQFKFALVNAAGTSAYWTNDGTHLNGTEPNSAVPLPVNNGLYSVLLGDTSLINMTSLPIIDSLSKGVQDVRLRVWFNDGIHGSQLLLPDQPISAVGYAFGAADSARISGQTVVRGSVNPDGSISGGDGFSVDFLPAGSNGVTLPSPVSVTSNSAIVTGSGFNSQLVPFKYIMLANVIYRIASIQNDSQLTLTRLYNGPSGSAPLVKNMTLYPRYTVTLTGPPSFNNGVTVTLAAHGSGVQQNGENPSTNVAMLDDTVSNPGNAFSVLISSPGFEPSVPGLSVPFEFIAIGR
ncbi:MAG: hypothetical protein ABI925_12315 [Verrucomicrobiota bacterium]